jgi:hypothetical protein
MGPDNTASERLFSYGTLQLESVQMSTFGRRLVGTSDALAGYKVVPLKIDDPTVVAISGKAVHTMATPTGRASDVVAGIVFAVTPDEIQRADTYEVAAVTRVSLVLQSGARAWVYVEAHAVVRLGSALPVDSLAAPPPADWSDDPPIERKGGDE